MRLQVITNAFLQVRQIITDDQSRGLVEAFQKFRNTNQEHTAQELAEYKSRAEKDIIGLEENIYGFTFVSIDDDSLPVAMANIAVCE